MRESDREMPWPGTLTRVFRVDLLGQPRCPDKEALRYRHHALGSRPSHRLPILAPGATIEDQIEAAVERALERVLGPYLAKLCEPEPAVYTVAQATVVMQVSEDTISRLVKRGVLPRVPHLDGKVLIPRGAVEKLVAGQGAD